MTCLPHSLSAHFNDSYAFYDRTDVRRCPACGNLTHKWEESLDDLRIRKRRKFDLSATYDGVLVVSDRFRNLYESESLAGLEFTTLPKDPTFHVPRATEVVAFDAERRGTRFEGICAVCGQYDAVAGATPVMLKSGHTIPARGFVRTDIEFGSHDEKHPIPLCGCEAARVLIEGGLRGLEIEKIAP